MDISSVIAEEQSCVKYYNSKDEEKDLVDLLHVHGKVNV